MAVYSYFFNAELDGGNPDRVYNADDIARYFDKLVGNGVFPNPSTSFQVTPTTPNPLMSVVVGAGQGWINGHKLVTTNSIVVTVSPADATLDRIDALIFYVDFNDREMGIDILTGTAAATPTPPPLTRTNSRYEMSLAYVYIPHGATAITSDMITDMRGDSTKCGYVQGLIQQVDTTTLWSQFTAQFENWLASVEDQFDAFKRFVRYEYHNTVTSGQSTLLITSVISQYASAYDAVEVYVNGLHLDATQYVLNGNTITFTPALKGGDKLCVVVYHMTSEA